MSGEGEKFRSWEVEELGSGGVEKFGGWRS